MTDSVAKFGRKFTLANRAMNMGFVLTVLGLVAVIARPAVAMYVAEILGQFALVLGVVVGGAGLAGTAAEWRSGAVVPSRTVVEGPAAVTVTPTPRPSGTVAEPPAE